MIPIKIQQKLQANWGDKAETMTCNVECRIFDPASTWEWWIYAQDPENTDTLMCIEHTNSLDAGVRISLEMLSTLFNTRGDMMEYDHEFKPRSSGALWQQLKIRYPNEVESNT